MWNPFAKHVYDKEMCFIRDLIEVATAMSDVVGVPAMRHIIGTIIERRALNNKLQEYTNLKSTIIEDCYPSSSKEKIDNAVDLLTAANDSISTYKLNDSQSATIRLRAFEAIRRMNFSKAEKEWLIINYITGDFENQTVRQVVMEQYLSFL